MNQFQIFVVILIISYLVLFVFHIRRLSRDSFDERIFRQAFTTAIFDRKSLCVTFFSVLFMLLLAPPSMLQAEFDPMVCTTVVDMVNTTGHSQLLKPERPSDVKVMITTVISGGYQGIKSRTLCKIQNSFSVS